LARQAEELERDTSRRLVCDIPLPDEDRIVADHEMAVMAPIAALGAKSDCKTETDPTFDQTIGRWIAEYLASLLRRCQALFERDRSNGFRAGLTALCTSEFFCAPCARAKCSASAGNRRPLCNLGLGVGRETVRRPGKGSSNQNLSLPASPASASLLSVWKTISDLSDAEAARMTANLSGEKNLWERWEKEEPSRGSDMSGRSGGHLCKGRTRSGKPCRAAATAGGLCFFHANPAKAAALGRLGGKKRHHFGTEKNFSPLPMASGGGTRLMCTFLCTTPFQHLVLSC
jgi:hypothetical protein